MLPDPGSEPVSRLHVRVRTRRRRPAHDGVTGGLALCRDGWPPDGLAHYLSGFAHAPRSPVSVVSSAIGWTFLILVVLALVVASVLRRRHGVAARERRALPRPSSRPGLHTQSAEGDSLGSLGLSPVRPAAARPVVRTASDDSLPSPLASGEPPAGHAWASKDESPSWTFDGDPAPHSDAVRVPDEPAGADWLSDTLGSEADENGRDDEAHYVATAPEPAPAERRAAPLTSVRPAPATVRPDSPLWDPPGPAEHLLASLAACTGGTVAVLRQDGAHYHVDALAGLAPAPWPGPLDAADGTHPLDQVPLDRLLSVFDGSDLDALTYLAPGTAETALVRALDESSAPRVLVVATLAVPADHVDLATARLVGDYVDLLATLRVDAEPGSGEAADDLLRTEQADDDRAHDETHEAEPAEMPTEDSAVAEGVSPPEPEEALAGGERRAPEPLPRTVILTGEIAAARDARRPLAFALVTLAHAEALLDGPAEAASAAEVDLAARLAAAPRVRRVEPFGPLLYGVFLDATSDQVSPWARSLSASGPALHVGAVAPAAGAPDAVRASATEALRDAYTQNVVCVVVD